MGNGHEFEELREVCRKVWRKDMGEMKVRHNFKN